MRNHVWIQNKITKKTIRWEDWDYLVAVINAFQGHKEVIILKARQLGISWLVCGYCLWLALFNENVRVLLMSQGEDEAWDLVAKCKFIYDHLTMPKPKIGHDSRGLIDFPVNNSEIKALSSVKEAGRSTDATIVVRDELETHEYARENFTAIGPTVDAGGQLIELSTIDKARLDSHFQERYKKARSGENNAYPIFLGWKLRPVRSEGMTLDEWFERQVKKKYSAWEIEQEYPETEAEALAPTKTRAFFDATATDNMLLDIIPNPLSTELSERYKQFVITYKEPIVGQKYCVFTDPSDGKTDPHATIVMDLKTFEVVAISHGKCPADLNAQIHHELVMCYNKAYNSFELNAFAGGKFSQTIGDLGTPNQHRQIKDRLGWWTSKNVKRTMLWGLEEAIRHNLIRVHNKDCINELKQFMLPEGAEPQAPRSGHDDWVIALAGVWQIRKSAPVGTVKITSFKYKES